MAVLRLRLLEEQCHTRILGLILVLPASITGVVAGTYSTTITDANGCTSTSSATLTEPVMLVAATVVDSNISCNGYSNGGATASATGGTMPYTYSWSNSATTPSITGVLAGYLYHYYYRRKRFVLRLVLLPLPNRLC